MYALLSLMVACSALLPLATAFPHLSPSANPSLISTRDVSTQAQRYLKNCQGHVDREKAAWDDYLTLAKAALLWQPGKQYQPTADFWFGTDSPQFADRISSKNLRAFLIVYADI
jgi:hypothetical protein